MFNNLLDNDLYKFSTSYAYMKLFPEAEGTFVFEDRNAKIYTQKDVEVINDSLLQMSNWEIPKDLYKELSTIHYIPKYYWEWLKSFRFDRSKIFINLDDQQHLQISVTDNLYKVTLYEIPSLYIVSEYNSKKDGIWNEFTEQRKLSKKIHKANKSGLVFSEFGTRRRFSSEWQERVVSTLGEDCDTYVGTSNVYLALKYNQIPIGTFPHEWVMFHGAIYGYKMANYQSLKDWSSVYNGDLGTALMDTYTTNVFLKNFSKKQAKLFDGVRQDSGDEFLVGNAVINRYKQLGIDPTTKTIIFSNALDFDKYEDIANYFKGRIKVSAGIGTNLTNNCCPSNIVMKLYKVRMSEREDWQNCIKLSDDFGKYFGDKKEAMLCYSTLNIPNQLNPYDHQIAKTQT